jgi:hypothetical protein
MNKTHTHMHAVGGDGSHSPQSHSYLIKQLIIFQSKIKMADLGLLRAKPFRGPMQPSQLPSEETQTDSVNCRSPYIRNDLVAMETRLVGHTLASMRFPCNKCILHTCVRIKTKGGLCVCFFDILHNSLMINELCSKMLDARFFYYIAG